MKLATDIRYALNTLTLTGWTSGDGTGNQGYNVADYFAADGRYLGPDEYGIEPIFEPIFAV